MSPKPPKQEGPAPIEPCVAKTCKAKAARFGFCNEHYDHFKFGLIKKTGEPVSDYERKMEHYLSHKTPMPAKTVKPVKKVA